MPQILILTQRMQVSKLLKFALGEGSKFVHQLLGKYKLLVAILPPIYILYFTIPSFYIKL